MVLFVAKSICFTSFFVKSYTGITSRCQFNEILDEKITKIHFFLTQLVFWLEETVIKLILICFFLLKIWKINFFVWFQEKTLSNY